MAGISSDSIEITTADGVAEAYVVRPDDGQDHPGVLFYIDAIGLRPQIERMADRIASWGYVVVAPNVFYRDGTADELAPKADLREPGNREAFFAGGVMDRVQGLGAQTTAVDGPAFVDAVLDLDGVEGPIGITGYCMGGRLAMRTAALRPDDVAAVGSFHAGGLVTDDPHSPHLGLPDAEAEFYVASADADHSMPPEAIAALESAFADAGLAFRSEVYAGAQHGYTMADTSSYDEAAAERHFRELEALLDRVLD